MIKEYFHIAHLISRHLSGEVTPEENRFLDKWRKESKSHEQLFQKICSDEHYAQHEIRKMEFDSQAGWKGVEARIKRVELRRRHLKLLRYVALLYVHAGLGKEFYDRDLNIPTVNEEMSRALFMSKKERKALSPLTAFLYGNSGPIWYRGLVRTDAKYHPLAQDSLQLMLKRYDVEHIIVGHTIFKDISTFYDGRVIGVNVDNEENRKKKRGRALLIDGNTYLVVGDKGAMRKLF